MGISVGAIRTSWRPPSARRRLQVGNRIPEDRLGKEASVEVPPGLYVVRIAGDVGGKPVQAERAVDVAAGEIHKVELTLA